jgi:hypothetical protein
MLNKGSDVRNHLSSAHKAHLVKSPSEHPSDVELRDEDSHPKTIDMTLKTNDERHKMDAETQSQ